MTDPALIEGTVFDIQDFATDDGPGVRTVVFLKGCPLRCTWCANPEGQSRKLELMVNGVRCGSCFTCREVCEAGAVTEGEDGGPVIDRRICSTCGQPVCIEACPERALRLSGGQWTAGELYERLRRNSRLFRNSGGGVTLSGGEPLVQPEFVGAILELCGRTGISVGVETCGLFDWKAVEQLIKDVDFIFFDIKGVDPEQHLKATGCDTTEIHANLERLAEKAADRITVSVPVVPGLIDGEEEISAIAALLRRLSISRMRLLGYHEFGRGKYEELGRRYRMSPVGPPSPDRLEQLRQVARDAGIQHVS